MNLQSAFDRVHKTLSSADQTNESEMKLAVVLQIVQELGWDIFDPNEVASEFTVPQIDGRAGRVDFALCEFREGASPPRRPLVFIEAKRVDRFARSIAEHDKAEEQLFRYAANQGIPIVILTDGNSWDFYLSMAAGPPGERIFYQAELRRSESHSEYALNFQKYMGRQAVITGQARRDAEGDLDSNTARDQARRSLPKAWLNLIVNDDQVRSLLADMVAEESGRRPSLDDVEVFLQSLAIPAQVAQPLQSAPASSGDPAKPSVAPPSGQKIVGFVLDDQPVRTGVGYQTLAEVVKAFQSRDCGFLPRFASETRGSRNYVVAQNPEEIFADQRLANLTMDLENGWWMRTNFSNSNIEAYIKTACRIAGVQFDSQLTITRE